MRFALLALAALLAAQDPPRTPVMWSLKKDQKVRYEFHHRLSTGDKLGVEESSLVFVVTLEGGDLGADLTNGYRLTFDRFAFQKGRDDYDSARDKAAAGGSYPRVLSKCVGTTIEGRISPAGKLGAFEPIRKMIQAGVDAWPDLKGRDKWDADGVDVVARKLEWLLRVGFRRAVARTRATRGRRCTRTTRSRAGRARRCAGPR